MKYKFIIAVLLSMVMSIFVQAKWLTPSKDICMKNGGTVSEEGKCEADWIKAKAICIASGTRLPTIGELKMAVNACGAKYVVNGEKEWEATAKKNLANSTYQTCLKEKGFGSPIYWSSTENAGGVQGVFFQYGYEYSYGKNNSNHVRCIEHKK